MHSRGNACKSIADKEDYTPSCRSLICTYTMETNITHALWSEFNLSPEENSSEIKSEGMNFFITCKFYLKNQQLNIVIIYVSLIFNFNLYIIL